MNWMNPFQILELLDRIFHFNRSLCKQTVDNLIRRRILRHLIRVCLHCLPMSHKRTLMLTGLDMQPVQTLMRCQILWHLIWVYTVLLLCHLLEINHKWVIKGHEETTTVLDIQVYVLPRSPEESACHCDVIHQYHCPYCHTGH